MNQTYPPIFRWLESFSLTKVNSHFASLFDLLTCVQVSSSDSDLWSVICFLEPFTLDRSVPMKWNDLKAKWTISLIKTNCCELGELICYTIPPSPNLCFRHVPTVTYNFQNRTQTLQTRPLFKTARIGPNFKTSEDCNTWGAIFFATFSHISFHITFELW